MQQSPIIALHQPLNEEHFGNMSTVLCREVVLTSVLRTKVVLVRKASLSVGGSTVATQNLPS